jgi:hypothetical protein
MPPQRAKGHGKEFTLQTVSLRQAFGLSKRGARGVEKDMQPLA